MWLVAVVLAAAAVLAGATSCDLARLQCAYRSGCGNALNNYVIACNDVLTRPTDKCPEECEHALIALTSTVEGKELMNCQCEDEYCRETKQRIEVCRLQVMNGAANATASCSLSQLICIADSQCAEALDYYHRLCWSMYEGKKCSRKCRNSIRILKKLDKASSLIACKCDGNEEYDCPKMQSNFARLCLKRTLYQRNKKIEKEHGITEPPDAASTMFVSRLLVLICVYWTFNL